MTYVVMSNCIQCKHSDCVDVCLTDCFHEGPNMLMINPEDCIDCGICQSTCPIDAIRPDNEVPEEEAGMVALNMWLSQQWPVLYKSKAPLPDAEKWRNVGNKLQYLLDIDGKPYAASPATAEQA